MKILILGEQGTGKPLFARMLASELSKISQHIVRIKDLELEPYQPTDGHTVYLKDSIKPDVPTLPLTFFDLVVIIPNPFEESMHEIHKFSEPLQRILADRLLQMRGEQIKPNK